MKGSEIDDPGHLIGLKPRRFPNWGARQQPIKICPLCSMVLNLGLNHWCLLETVIIWKDVL